MATKKKVAEEIKEEVKVVETKAKKAATAVKKAPAKAKTAAKALHGCCVWDTEQHIYPL